MSSSVQVPETRQHREQEHFDRLASATGEIWWGSNTPAGLHRLRRRAAQIADLLGNRPNGLILELGCGVGALSGPLLERMPQLSLIGCDISFKLIEIARKRYSRYPQIRMEVADATHLPYLADTFDAVIGNAVLHHLPLEAALRESFRVLKPGGFLWFSEPNMMNPQVALERNFRPIGRLLQNTEDETAFFRWPLARKIRLTGFCQVEVKPFDFLHPLVPSGWMKIVDRTGRLIEKCPLLKEISGSLLIEAQKA